MIVTDHSESVQNIKVPNVSADVTSTTVTSLESTVTKSTEHITLPIDGKNIFSPDVPEAYAPMLLFDEEVRTSCVFNFVSFDSIEFTTKQQYHLFVHKNDRREQRLLHYIRQTCSKIILRRAVLF